MIIFLLVDDFVLPSMKVPPKRKGNFGSEGAMRQSSHPLNESPSEKEGKLGTCASWRMLYSPSMKVPPKRKGNLLNQPGTRQHLLPLNESPSEKEGKWGCFP